MSQPLCSARSCPSPPDGEGGWFCARGEGEPWEFDFQESLHALRVLSQRAWGRYGGPERPEDATPPVECHWDPPGGPTGEGPPRRWRLLTRAPAALGGAHLQGLQAELQEMGVDAGRVELTRWAGGRCRAREGFGEGLDDLVDRCREILSGR